MSFSGQRNSLLLHQFRTFVAEMVRLKSRATRSTEMAALAVSMHPGDNEGPAAEEIYRRLLSLLEDQALEAGRSGGAFGFEVYREAQFVMAGLADEIFLKLDWPGRMKWTLLESKLFSSHSAGEVFFEKLDRLLRQRDPVYLDLAAIYFAALSLGFEGKFGGLEDTTRIDRYRGQLFSMIFNRGPELMSGSFQLFPENYLRTLDSGSGKKLPDPRTWLGAVGLVLVLWIGISHLVWVRLTSELHGLTGDINRTASDTRSK